MQTLICNNPSLIAPQLQQKLIDQQSIEARASEMPTLKKDTINNTNNNTLIKPTDFTYSLSPLQTLENTRDASQVYTPAQQNSAYIQKVADFQLKQTGFGNTEVLLIRHGTTVFNLISSKFQKQTGLTFKDKEALFSFDQLLMDTQLHQSGKDQAQELGQKLINNKNTNVEIHTVFVSPLRRALQTCYNIFKDHPQRKNIKFVVFPLVSEIYSKVCDIFDSRKTPLDQELKEFFDFSQINQLWQVENLQDQELKQKISQQLKFESQTKYNKNLMCSNLEETMTEFSDMSFPKNVEQYDSVFQRGLYTKQYIKDYIQQQQITQNQKVVVISHNSYLRNFTASAPDDGKSGIGGMKFANCEALLYKF